MDGRAFAQRERSNAQTTLGAESTALSFLALLRQVSGPGGGPVRVQKLTAEDALVNLRSICASIRVEQAARTNRLELIIENMHRRNLDTAPRRSSKPLHKLTGRR
jgi:hypothetical protein